MCRLYGLLDLDEFVALMKRLADNNGEFDPLVHLYRCALGFIQIIGFMRTEGFI